MWTVLTVADGDKTGVVLSYTSDVGYVYLAQQEAGKTNLTLTGNIENAIVFAVTAGETEDTSRLSFVDGTDTRYLMYRDNLKQFGVYGSKYLVKSDYPDCVPDLMFCLPGDASNDSGDTDSTEPESAEYYVVAKADDKHYAVSNTMYDGVTFNKTEVTIVDGVVTTANVDAWMITEVDENGTVTLATAEGKYLIRQDGTSNLGLSDTAENWVLTRDETTGYYTIQNSDSSDTRYLSTNANGFKAYAAADANQNRYIEFLLIPVSPDSGDTDDLGHTEEKVTGKAATCTEAGLTDGVKCSVCGETLVAQEEIPALGHRYKDGKCTVCGEADPDYEAPHEHSYTAVVTDPTCTEGGYTTYTCECGDTYTADETEAGGHNVVLISRNDPTCEENGSEYYACERCGGQESNIILEATGHSWDEGKVATEATCTKAGVKTYTCSACEETKTEEIAATGHVDADKDDICDNCVNNPSTGDNAMIMAAVAVTVLSMMAIIALPVAGKKFC